MSEIDYERFMPYLKDMDLSDEQKRMVIEDVWNMMQSFVDQAFGIHPVQLAIRERLRSQNASSAVESSTKNKRSKKKRRKKAIPNHSVTKP